MWVQKVLDRSPAPEEVSGKGVTATLQPRGLGTGAGPHGTEGGRSTGMLQSVRGSGKDSQNRYHLGRASTAGGRATEGMSHRRHRSTTLGVLRELQGVGTFSAKGVTGGMMADGAAEVRTRLPIQKMCVSLFRPPTSSH